MADPIGALGTAVGVISLGIQVCQGLISYYSAYKGRNSKIDNVCDKINGLTGVFVALEEILPGLQNDHGSLASQVNDILTKSRESITELQGVLDKCKQTTPARGVREKVQIGVQKALFPFRQDTLQQLENVTSGLQGNLDTALGVLHL